MTTTPDPATAAQAVFVESADHPSPDATHDVRRVRRNPATPRAFRSLG